LISNKTSPLNFSKLLIASAELFSVSDVHNDSSRQKKRPCAFFLLKKHDRAMIDSAGSFCVSSNFQFSYFPKKPNLQKTLNVMYGWQIIETTKCTVELSSCANKRSGLCAFFRLLLSYLKQ
jgi:hypothetical protein